MFNKLKIKISEDFSYKFAYFCFFNKFYLGWRVELLVTILIVDITKIISAQFDLTWW
jgi:hypothetical protein